MTGRVGRCTNYYGNSSSLRALASTHPSFATHKSQEHLVQETLGHVDHDTPPRYHCHCGRILRATNTTTAETKTVEMVDAGRTHRVYDCQLNGRLDRTGNGVDTTSKTPVAQHNGTPARGVNTHNPSLVSPGHASASHHIQ
jgi:hypothetical protein